MPDTLAAGALASERNLSVAISFALYIGVTFLLAWLAHRKARGQRFLEEFFVAGRGIGAWVLALTWVATMASGGTFIGAPALAWQNGWTAHLWVAGFMVLTFTGMGILGKRIAFLGAATGAMTMPDLIRDRFESRGLGTILAIITLLLYVAYLVAQYIAGARVMEVALGMPYWAGLLLVSLTVTLYTAWGGFRAVAWTDAFQAIVMLLGILLTLGFALHKAGGFTPISAYLAAQSPELLAPPGPENFLPLSQALSFFVVWPLAVLGQPALMSRFLSSGDPRVLSKATLINGLYVLLLYPAIMTLGIIGRYLAPGIAMPDQAMPATIVAAVPTWLAGLVLAAPFAAIMSTISSFLLVTGSAIVRDLYHRNLDHALSDRKAQLLSQGTTFLIGALALGIAFRPPEYLQYIVIFSATGLASTFIAPTMLAVFWPRATRVGAYAALCGGFGSFALQYALYGTRSWLNLDPFVWSLSLSFLCGILASYATPPQRAELRNAWFGDSEA
ncbi:MAG: sodium/solute symporter [Bryobacterales bacterium]|nr:sodium/solute symporter [Bryobacterales bacterium]